MIVRSLALIAFGTLSVPALAHPGDHGTLTAFEHIAHIASSAFHLLPLAVAIALIALVLRKSGRDRARVKLRKDR